MFYYFRRISQVETLRNQAMHRRKGRTARHWSQDIAGRNEEGKTNSGHAGGNILELGILHKGAK